MEARWATVDDVDELVRLREVMFDGMSRGGDPTWRPVVAEQLRAGFRDDQYFAAVADDPGGAGLIGGAVGMVWERLAGVGDNGRFGYVQSMATNPAWRSRGVARAVMALLLDGFRARGVRKVGLHYTPAGEPLYRSLGFVEPSQPELRWFGDRRPG